MHTENLFFPSNGRHQPLSNATPLPKTNFLSLKKNETKRCYLVIFWLRVKFQTTKDIVPSFFGSDSFSEKKKKSAYGTQHIPSASMMRLTSFYGLGNLRKKGGIKKARNTGIYIYIYKYTFKQIFTEENGRKRNRQE